MVYIKTYRRCVTDKAYRHLYHRSTISLSTDALEFTDVLGFLTSPSFTSDTRSIWPNPPTEL